MRRNWIFGYNIGLNKTTGTNSADMLGPVAEKKLLVLYYFHDLARHGNFHYTLSFQSLGTETAQFQCKPQTHCTRASACMHVCMSVWVCVFLTNQCVPPRCSRRSSLVPGHHHTGQQSGMQPAWWQKDMSTSCKAHSNLLCQYTQMYFKKICSTYIYERFYCWTEPS